MAKPATKKKPAAKKQPATLVAKYVLQVNSRAEVEALPAAERKRFAAGASRIVGGKTLEQTYKQLDAMMMGIVKLQLFRGGTHVYDVWINDVHDDGSVLFASTAKHSGIGISQSNVYAHAGGREEECAAIAKAIYKGKVKWPPIVEDTAWIP